MEGQIEEHEQKHDQELCIILCAIRNQKRDIHTLQRENHGIRQHLKCPLTNAPVPASSEIFVSPVAPLECHTFWVHPEEPAKEGIVDTTLKLH